MVENEQYILSGFMENVASSKATAAIQPINSKKRFRTDMSLQKQSGSDSVRDTAKQSELLMLKEALKSERNSLQRLYGELEEERGSSMTAANEAMAMITRLQEEKAAVLVEARRYKVAAEERENHNQEAISLLKEALLTKEDDLLALQELLCAYKERLLSFETEQGQYLEDRGDSDQLLLLEGLNTPLSCMDSNRAIVCYGHDQGSGIGAGLWMTGKECEDPEFEEELYGSQCTKSFRNHDERRCEGVTERDCHAGGKLGSETALHEQLILQSRMHNGVHNQESEKLQQSQEPFLDDVSVSVFARVQRLEECFEYLRENQAVERQHLKFTRPSDMKILDHLESEERAKIGRETTSKVPYDDRKPRDCMTSEGLAAADFGSDDGRKPEVVLECLSFEKARLDVWNDVQEQCPKYYGEAGLGRKCRENELNVQRVHDERLNSFSVMYDDESEGVHDVYEVQSEVKQSFVHPSSEDYTGNMAAPMFDMLHEVNKDSIEVGVGVPSNYAGTEACIPVGVKLSMDVSSLDVKDVRAHVSDEDVRQLKIRLQALEGERVFMKEAIDSLRKENKELKVLQDLAQQLRELNIDARRNEVPGQQGLPSLLTFLKQGVMSFAGHPRPTSTKGDRCLLYSCSFSNKQRQDGLLHVLDQGSPSPKSACVTRERKVNLNIA